MQLKFFTIPAMGEGNSVMEEELNAFLRGHRILNVQRELVNNGQMSCWCCCVEYIEGSKPLESPRQVSKEKTDYRKVLSAEDFEKFKILRECRKTLAVEDAVPAYAIFLDEQLAAVAQQPEINEHTLKSVDGLGDKKMEKYGKRFLELWDQMKNEAGGKSVLENSGN